MCYNLYIMNAGKVLRENEARALQSNQFVSRVEGKTTQKGSAGRLKSWSAAGFIVAMILVFLMFFSSGNLIPEGISTRLIEETDMQYADAVESKKWNRLLENREIDHDCRLIKRINDENNKNLINFII